MESGARLGPYEIREQLGKGGMGEVWLARDTTLDRDIAIKVLPPSFTSDVERLARFEREAKAVAALSHPNIVTIYGFGTEGGTTYAAMELLKGSTLRDLMDDGPLPVRKAVDLARQIANGLDAAHANGVVHRDLKPENVFVTPDGQARILDFGLADTTAAPAHDSDDTSLRTRLTDPGSVVGTAGYMAPEQARGAETHSTTDIFALGVMLHEMLAGKHPFPRETTAEVLTAILREDPPDLNVGGTLAPPALARVVRRCLEKAPEERFQSARDLAFALDTALVDSGSSQPAIAAPPASQGPRLRAVGPMLVASALAGAAAFAGGWWLRPMPAAPEPPRTTELTFTGTDHQPSVSPDGRLMAFTSSRNGMSQIWLRQFEGGGEQPLTEGPDWRPRFLPGGDAIGFVRRDGDVYSGYRVPVVGGQPRQVIEHVEEIAWSPDGRYLAFLRGTLTGDASVLGVMNLETSEERELVDVGGLALLGVSWSADSRRIATTRASTQGGAGRWRILLVDVASGGARELDMGDTELLSGPEWVGSDGIVYAKTFSTVFGSPDPDQISYFNLTRDEERVLLWEPYLFPFRGSFTAATRLSLLDDDRLVFDSHRHVQTIQELDLRTGAARELVAGVASDRQPAYSPDGKRVLFTSSRSGNVDLFSYDREADRLLQLTESPASDWDGAYTPDGESMLWSSDRGGNLEIWMADADGSNPRQVSRNGVNAENPTMTRSGEWIVYTTGDPDRQGLMRIRPDGTDETQIYAGSAINPEVSRDGRYALFIDNVSSTSNILRVIDIETAELIDFDIRIEFGPEALNITYGRARWMPDDAAIVFVDAGANGNPSLSIQDFVPGQDTSATRREVPGVAATGIVESFGISPDGNYLALATSQWIRRIKLAENLPTLR